MLHEALRPVVKLNCEVAHLNCLLLEPPNKLLLLASNQCSSQYQHRHDHHVVDNHQKVQFIFLLVHMIILYYLFFPRIRD